LLLVNVAPFVLSISFFPTFPMRFLFDVKMIADPFPFQFCSQSESAAILPLSPPDEFSPPKHELCLSSQIGIISHPFFPFVVADDTAPPRFHLDQNREYFPHPRRGERRLFCKVLRPLPPLFPLLSLEGETRFLSFSPLHLRSAFVELERIPSRTSSFPVSARRLVKPGSFKVQSPFFGRSYDDHLGPAGLSMISRFRIRKSLVCRLGFFFPSDAL